MVEEEVNKVGKTGLNKKVIAGVVVAVVVVAGVGGVVWWKIKGGQGAGSQSTWFCYADAVNYQDRWEIKILDISKNSEGRTTRYEFVTSDGKYEPLYEPDKWFSILDIRFNASLFGITWLDNNNDTLLDSQDVFVINKSGGIRGIPRPHDKFTIWDTKTEQNPCIIYLPPADFLNMNVEEISDGWNMTVTYVNETIPEAFTEGWRLGFRVENESGVFYGIQKIGWSVPLDMIGSTYVAEPGTYDAHNMTYFQINWFDKDGNEKLSVNDTFLIDNFLSTDEKLSFRLFCNQYGWGHVIFEVMLP